MTRQCDSVKVGVPYCGLPWRVSADLCFPGASRDKRKSLGYGEGQKGDSIIKPRPQKGDRLRGVSLVYYTVLLCEGQPVIRGTQNNHLLPTHLSDLAARQSSDLGWATHRCADHQLSTGILLHGATGVTLLSSVMLSASAWDLGCDPLMAVAPCKGKWKTLHIFNVPQCVTSHCLKKVTWLG